MQKRYQVFVSSTYTDLQEERGLVFNTLMKMNHIPAGMELFPALDEEQGNFIKRVIDDSDYYVLIIGGRYGSVTSEGLSYTELEYDYAVGKGIKVIALLHKNPDDIPYGKSEKDPDLRQRLTAFREKAGRGRLVNYWEAAAELPGILALSLSSTITTYPAIGWVRADQLGSSEAVAEVNALRKQLDKLRVQLQAALVENEELLAEPVFENIASINEKVTIGGTYFKQLYGTTNWSITVSWLELFTEIAPALADPPTDAAARNRFAPLLFELYGDSDAGQSPVLDERDFFTIRIQLTALKLVMVERSKTVGGGIALFWNLTQKGENLLMEHRVVRSSR